MDYSRNLEVEVGSGLTLEEELRAVALEPGLRLSEPPTCNTGVESAEGVFKGEAAPLVASLETCVDYLRVTFKDNVPLDYVQNWFDGPGGWVRLDFGGYRYGARMQRGDLTIYFDGQPGMGTCLQISGQGCRQLEAEGFVTDWQDTLKQIKEGKGEVSRIDVAIDDKAQEGPGLLDMDVIQAEVIGRNFASKCQKFRSMTSSEGRSVYVGSRVSTKALRFYDKRAEQEGKGVEVPVQHWTRAELEFKKESAQALVDLIIEQGLSVAAGVMAEFIQFKERGEGLQPCRWDDAAWWVVFLQGVERIKLALADKVQGALGKSWRWVQKSVLPLLAVLRMAGGWDSPEWFDVEVAFAAGRLKPKHLALLTGQPGVGQWRPHLDGWLQALR